VNCGKRMMDTENELKKVRNGKRWVFVTSLLSVTLLSLFYIVGFVYTGLNNPTYGMIFILTLYIIPITALAMFLGSTVPVLSSIYSYIALVTMVGNFGIQILYGLQKVYLIITLNVGSVENWVFLIIAMIGGAIILSASVTSLFFTNLVKRVYRMVYEVKYCVRDIFKYERTNNKTYWVFFAFVIFELFVVIIVLIFGYQYYWLGVQTHPSILVTLLITVWFVCVFAFFAESLTRYKKDEQGVISLASMICLGISIAHFVAILVFYVVNLFVCKSPICWVVSVDMGWTVWVTLILNIFQGLISVFTAGFSFFYLYKNGGLKSLKEHFQNRQDFLGNKIGNKMSKGGMILVTLKK